MNIKITDLKRFRNLSSHICGSGILPSSNSIKFGSKLIERASAAAFVSMICMDATEEILVDEDVLWSLVDKSSSGFISITSKGNKTIVSDGLYTVPIPKLSVSDYMLIPNYEIKRFPVSSEFLEAIGGSAEAALSMTAEPSLYMYLHIGNKSVCAGNGYMGVMFPIEENYVLVLEKKCATILSKLDILEYAEVDNHYFFYEDETVLGFTKQEIGYFSDFRKLMIGGEKISFSASKSDIKNFNELALSISKDGGVVTISSGGIEMWDSAKERAPRRDLDGIKISEPFSFRPSNMNKAIVPLNAKTLDFYDGKGLYYIKSKETKATAIIAKIQKTNA